MKRKIFITTATVIAHMTIALFTMNIENNKYYTTLIFILLSYIFGLLFIKTKKELLIAILGYLIITTIITVAEGGSILRFFLTISLFFILSIVSSYYSKRKKYLILLFPLIFILFMIFGYKNYISLIKGRNSVITKVLPKISLYNAKLKETTFNQKDKVYVLDFWATSCGVCIQKFPGFEKTVLKHKNNSNVIFYSVNIPELKESIKSNITMVKEKYNFNFNKLYAKDFSPCDSLGFNKFPTLIILKNGIVHYKGSLILDNDIKIHHIDTEIQRVLAIE